jgi:hypothetical protein
LTRELLDKTIELLESIGKPRKYVVSTRVAQACREAGIWDDDFMKESAALPDNIYIDLTAMEELARKHSYMNMNGTVKI